eukprot:133612-Pyramimonas_sp.AAC.1
MSESVFRGLAVGESTECVDENDGKSWMIADTACQIMVHGVAWGKTHVKRLEARSLCLVELAAQERFKSGGGLEVKVIAEIRWGCPIGIAGVALWVRSSQVRPPIPR